MNNLENRIIKLEEAEIGKFSLIVLKNADGSLDWMGQIFPDEQSLDAAFFSSGISGVVIVLD